MRAFYLAYEKQQKVSAKFELGWSHYLKLMRIGDINERKFYEIECHKNNWSLRELQRQFDAALYQRLVLSRDKAKIEELAEKGLVIESAQDALKDPYILEFIGLPEQNTYSESELEQALIDKLYFPRLPFVHFAKEINLFGTEERVVRHRGTHRSAPRNGSFDTEEKQCLIPI